LKILHIAALIFTLSACATQNTAIVQQTQSEIASYTSENRPKAMSGAIKWSALYQGYIDIYKKLPNDTKGKIEAVTYWVEALNIAREYEEGRLSKEDFYKWRENANNNMTSSADKNSKAIAECKYQAATGAAAVTATGRSGLNFDQMYKEKELFELCMKTK